MAVERASPGGAAATAAVLSLSLLLLLLTAGCIVLPQTEVVYDPDCKTHTRQVTLQAAYLGGLQRCAGEACAVMLATMGIVTAASVVVSGSIALVGNIVYFMELQGRCQRGPVGAAPAAPSAVAAVPAASASASAK